MKRHLLFLCCLLVGFLFLPVFSHAELMDLSEMTIEELLVLRDNIDAMLEEKGHHVYFDIERGDKGEDVSRIQEQLTTLGFYSGKITGKFDSQTQKAFKSFEKVNGLENDGIASRADQIVLFGADVLAKVSPTPAPTPLISPAPTADRLEHDVSFDYEDCLRYPEKYMGSAYQLKGKVEQTIGSREDGFQLRFSVLGSSNEIIFVSIAEDPGYNILEGDWLILDLIMSGTATYESIWGKEITKNVEECIKVIEEVIFENRMNENEILE